MLKKQTNIKKNLVHIYKLRTRVCTSVPVKQHNTQSLSLRSLLQRMKDTALIRMLFVILLGLSHLMCFKAVPITRTESLMQSPQVVHLAVENVHNHKVMMNGRNKWAQEEESLGDTDDERMDLELHDYPPSGANGRHTPRPYP